MNTRIFAAIVAAVLAMVQVAYAAETPSPATRTARLLSGKYSKVIKDADVERLEREHRVCELHKIYATSAYVQEQYAAANIVVVAKMGWYEFSDGRIDSARAQSAKALARELTRRLRNGIYFPSRCEYREETQAGWFLQAIDMGSKGDLVYSLRWHLKHAKLESIPLFVKDRFLPDKA